MSEEQILSKLPFYFKVQHFISNKNITKNKLKQDIPFWDLVLLAPLFVRT